MKRTLVLLLLLLSFSNAYSQSLSAGGRAGASMWNNADAEFNTVNPEAGVFVRFEPIKKLALDLGFTAYNLKREFANYDISHKITCADLNLAIQYNYLRLFAGKLKFYAGLDGSYVFASLELKRISNSTQPIFRPFNNDNSSFQFPMIGINQSFIYQISKSISTIATVSYKTNMGELNGPFPRALAGYTRLNIQAGVSYQIH